MFAEFLVFRAGFPIAQGALDEDFQPVDIHRLGHKIIGTALHGLDRGIDRSVSGHHDANRGFGQLQGLFNQLHAIFPAQAQVRDHHLRGISFHRGQGSVAVSRHVDLVVILQRIPQTIAGVFFIIDDEKGFIQCHFDAGNTVGSMMASKLSGRRKRLPC